MLEKILESKPHLSTKPFEKKIFMIYGPAGVGKSTFFSKFKNHLFLNTDPGLEFLKVRNIPIGSWKDFVKIVDELVEKRKDPLFKNVIIVIDLIDGVYSLCRKSILKRYGLSHETDTPYGKTFDIIKTEFQTVLAKLAAFYGIGFISHSREIEIKSRITSISKTQPTISGGAGKFVEGMCDFIGFCETSMTKEEKALGKRYITFTPTENLTAKDRAGLFPEKMPLDFNVVSNTYEKNFNKKFLETSSDKKKKIMKKK